jgi:hypothetical protein
VLGEDVQEFEVFGDGTLAFVRGGPAGGTGLAWVDREGIETRIEGLEPGLYFQPRLSPDESRVAYYRADAGHDVEVLNLRNGGTHHVTLDPHQDLAPAWVDDESLVFASMRSGAMNVYRKRADGSGVAESLTDSEAIHYPLQVTANGMIALNFGTLSEGVQVGLKTMELESKIQRLASPGRESHDLSGWPVGGLRVRSLRVTGDLGPAACVRRRPMAGLARRQWR